MVSKDTILWFYKGISYFFLSASKLARAEEILRHGLVFQAFKDPYNWFPFTPVDSRLG